MQSLQDEEEGPAPVYAPVARRKLGRPVSAAITRRSRGAQPGSSGSFGRCSARPASAQSAMVKVAPVPAVYDRITRSHWLLVFPAPISGAWVTIHGNMRVPPAELALGPVHLTDFPSEFPMPPMDRAPKPRKQRS